MDSKDYKVQITENGERHLLPALYTYQEALEEVEMQEDLNCVNVLLGEAPAVFDIVKVK